MPHSFICNFILSKFNFRLLACFVSFNYLLFSTHSVNFACLLFWLLKQTSWFVLFFTTLFLLTFFFFSFFFSTLYVDISIINLFIRFRSYHYIFEDIPRDFVTSNYCLKMLACSLLCVKRKTTKCVSNNLKVRHKIPPLVFSTTQFLRANFRIYFWQSGTVCIMYEPAFCHIVMSWVTASIGFCLSLYGSLKYVDVTNSECDSFWPKVCCFFIGLYLVSPVPIILCL